MVELPTASDILELRTERKSDVAIDPLRLSAVNRVAQPGMATPGPLRVPACSPHSKVTLSVTLSVTPFYWCNGLHSPKEGVTPSFWWKIGCYTLFEEKRV